MPKVKAHVEAGFQFPRQPCNIYLIENTLSLKSIVKPRSLNAHTAEGAIESVRINVVSVLSGPCYLSRKLPRYILYILPETHKGLKRVTRVLCEVSYSRRKGLLPRKCPY